MTILPVAFESYQSRSRPFSAQRLINLYWETAPEMGKSQGILYKRPGESLFTTAGDGLIRGAHEMAGEYYVISGEEAFKVNEDGSTTFLGTVPGTDFVDMDDNGTEIAVVAGTDGYILTSSTATKITDGGFRFVSSVIYQDSFFIWTVADTGRFFISPSFAGLGPYDPLDVATAEFAPDNLVKVFSDHDDLLNFGIDTVEPWFNTGATDFPFGQNPGTSMEVGLLARNTVKKLDNTVFWFGSDQRGGRTVWRARGYTPTRVSTHALEAQWDQFLTPEDAYAFTFRMEGHAFYVLTFPGKATFVYDASTNRWCEWQTFGCPDWSAIGFANVYGKRLVCDRRSNKVLSIDVDNLDDSGNIIRWEATSPPVASPDNEWLRHDFLRIDIESGVGLTTGQGSDPQIFLEWADEDGTRFGNKHLLDIGKIGDTQKRVYRRRLGKARNRTYRISGSDPVKIAILGAYLKVQQGRW